ncbi:hypothetical protein E4U42_004591 [Claviceps africana]|uniref:Cupin type-2 domain-containing protein n=1 Tax=Claviceps africana TaxID=83212 RepID=A0A8K0JC43_9HYPO|nr:hypothetical protein E4U42_004591 [Claviceps africana]
MASLVPLLSEILPMVMPATAHVARAKEIESAACAAQGPVTVRPAIVDKCAGMSSTVMTVRPHSETQVQHNSEQDAIIYTVSGSGVLTVNQGFGQELREHDISAGDFAFVPAWTEHRFSNSQHVDLVCVVIHGGSRPAGATFVDWGGDEDTSTK